MKSFLNILILTFILLLSSCGEDVIVEPPTLPRDPETLQGGGSKKTPNYIFTSGFIYHEWIGQEPINSAIHFSYKINSSGYNTIRKHPIKKLVTSKFFDIYVDTENGARVFKKATNMTDVAYDKLIRELEKEYSHIKSVYGEPTDIDGNGKIEIIFHESEEMNGKAGYFCNVEYLKNFMFSATADALYISSAVYITTEDIKNKYFDKKCVNTIFHELQHDINARRKHYTADRWLDEALSISTYPVLYKGSGSGRSSDLSSDKIRNGIYFFSWDNNENQIISENYFTAGNFMYWLYLHGNGDSVIRDICREQPQQIDIKSIGNAVRKNIPTLKNANDATIIKSWYKANFLNEKNSIYGYKNKNNNLKIGQANNRSGKISLPRYCAVYTTPDMYSANFSLMGKGIQMEKLKNSSGEEWLLIFNGSENTIDNVKINPNVRSVRSLSAENENEEDEWYDHVYYKENF